MPAPWYNTNGLLRRLKLLPYILFTGLISNASYLSYKYYEFYYRGGFLNSLGCTDDCDTVMMSPYALLFKIPIPFYGLAFYTLVLLAYIAWHRAPVIARSSATKQSTTLELLLILGLIASAIFIYLMYFQLHAICKFCLAAHSMFIALSALYFLVLRKHSIAR